MPVPIADTVYDQTQPWSSINTPTGVYKQGPDQVQKMAHAIATARLDVPAEALRVYAPTNVYYKSPTGGMQPTIDDVIGQTAGQAPQASIFDYSGTAAGTMATSVPSISLGS
jgi:hypothetical protein